MTATKAEISDWFDRGVGQGSTHLIVVCDSFSHDDYPVFATGETEAIEKYEEHRSMEMQRIVEVYDLRMEKDAQLEEPRSMHLPGSAPKNPGKTPTQADFDAFRAKRLSLIQQHGFTVQGVFPTEDDQGPLVGYTIGLSTKGLPEVMMLGLPYEAVVAVLNAVGRQLVSGETKGEPGELVYKAANMPLKLIEIPDQVARSYALGAFGYAKDAGAKVKLLQALWPDVRGVHPGTVGCDIPSARIQDATYQLVIRGDGHAS